MKLNDQVISPRAFSLGGMLIILVLLYASNAFAAECPNHCSEDRIEAYERAAPVSPAQRIKSATPTLASTIQSVGYVCDDILSADYTDLPGVTVWHVNCYGGLLRYTVISTPKRSIVYPFWRSL